VGSGGQVPPSGRHEDFVEQLCREHEAQLLQYLTRMLGRPDLAQEVAQDTYEKLHKMYRAEEVQLPHAILFKIATNFALKRLRRARLESTVITGSADMDEVSDETAPPDRRAMADQVTERIVQVITELRPNLRKVLVMAHIQGKDRRQIAGELGISLKRVDKRMTQALKNCRQRLSELGVDLVRSE